MTVGGRPKTSPFRLKLAAFGVGVALGAALVGAVSLPFVFLFNNAAKAGVDIVPQAPKPQAGPDADDFIEGNYWALIIGINKYPTMDKDKQLEAARLDAEAIAKVLTERYGFSKERMVELYDEAASRKGIIRAFSSLKRRLTDKDSLFIYYAGHGEYETTGKGGKADKDKTDGMGYWIPSDAELDDPASYIFNSQVRDYLANIPARHIYAVVDSCFSGSLMGRTRALGLSKDAIKELYQSPSRWILASGGLYPVPDVADKSKQGHSTFAWYFMKILKQNTQPYLLAKDIAEPLAIRVSNEVQGQLPRSAPVLAAGDEGGQFVFHLKREFQKGAGDTAAPAGDLTALEKQLQDAEQAVKKQAEEFEKKKQAMLERLKKLEEEKKRQQEEEEKQLAAAVKEAEEKLQREAKERDERLKAEAERAKKLDEERLQAAQKFEQEQKEREQKAKEAELARQKLEQEQKAEAERIAAQKKEAEERAKQAELAKKKAEEERKAEEARLAELKRQSDEKERQRQAEFKRQEEERKRQEDARKAEEARLAAELKKRQEEEQARLEAERKKMEELRKKQEAEKDAARLAELKRQAEEARLAEEKRQAEEKERQRLAELKRQEEERKRQEDARKAEEARQAELKRQEEERKAEEARLAELKRQSEEKERQRLAEFKRQEEARLAEEKRLAELRRQEDEKERQRQAELKKKEEEHQRLEAEMKAAKEREEKRLAELKKKQEEEERRLAEERRVAEEKRKAEEKRLAEDKAKAEAERVAALKRQQEQEAKRKAEEAQVAAALAHEAEEQKAKLAEAKKKAEEAQKAAEQAAKAGAPAETSGGGSQPIVEATLRPYQAPKAKDLAAVVTIPAGEFIMGSKSGDGQPDESPQRSVSLDAYTIDKYEVTVEQYAAYLKKSGAEPPDFWERVNQKEDANRPVVGMDWLEANEYCEYFGKRLPTEAQWEKAARGTDGRKYPWGSDDPSPLLANFASGVAFSYGKSLSPVGSYEQGKSPYGVYDMVGNVWEWLLDWYDKGYYPVAAQKNPAGPSTGDYKVIRGGSWSKRPAVARVAGRMYLSPSQRSNSVGFRCAGEAK